MGGGGGGAWKVAYADFVTAMMALFMVLWIMSQDEEVLLSAASYFKQPFSINPKAWKGAFSPSGSGSGASKRDRDSADSHFVSYADLTMLHMLQQDLMKQLDLKDVEDRPIDIVVTDDGVRVIIYDKHGKPFFEPSSTAFTPWGLYVTQNLAWLIARYPMKVFIESHTPKGFRIDNPEYGPWELTADRANTFRRTLIYYAVSEEKIGRVTGYADADPLPGVPPESEENQRIELGLAL